MKKTALRRGGILLLLFVISCANLFSQTPKIYINLGTHNEILNETYDTNEAEFDNAVTVIDQILTHVNGLGAKWNFQTCSKFVLGALNWDNAFSSSTDVLERMYLSGNVEIDPRNKTEFPNYMYNISDVYHLLDSCGVTSTHTVGGFLHYPYENQDWTQFRNPKIGAVYNLPWQADIIWGGGSPNHIQDANNYGVWKPKDGTNETDFYTHQENQNLWLVGNGCAPVISDTRDDVQWIVNLMRDNIEKIQNGTWPSDKFYSLTFMINVRDFDQLGFFVKVRTVLDSIQTFVDNGDMEWATITQKLAHFQDWRTTSSLLYSQWTCEEATAATNSTLELENETLVLYPNPVSTNLFVKNLKENSTYKMYNLQGKTIDFGELSENGISVEDLISGIYFVEIENQGTKKTFRVLVE